MARAELSPDQWMRYPGLAGETYQRMVNEGILVAAPDESGRLNPMTIGWGVWGLIWGKPIFQVLVRPSRRTYECVERAGDYTVNVLPESMNEVADYCGTVSGRDADKMADRDLSPLPSKYISSPGIAQANIVFECQVVHFNDIQKKTFPDDILSNYYPEGDFHRVYFGEIKLVSVEQGFLDGLG